MLRYDVKHWEESARRGSDCRSMLFSAPDHFNMTGGSDRRLQEAFRATGQTPWEHLTAIRLTKARARLLSGAGGSVTAIALDCGFSHLGRFAQSYRRKYNEAPSATLARATDQSRKPF
ncbi:helix-turn-helix domain-containing protein [Sulfitobacter sp. 1A13421]|uniref:helix-turn-helix domain-containing protein n=1 Tax=Sulfitobacter sp. 1A13421 TaxID=3368595 RepID=UPI003745933D